MSGTLFKIPLTKWVRGTIEKMDQNDTEDVENWNRMWLETYFQLGGQSHETGLKGCPKHAAYGLWRTGRIKGTKIPLKLMAIAAIDAEYGKNTAYAAIAIELIAQNKAADNTEDLWQQVRIIYREKVGQEPAIHHQGAVSVARILYDESQIDALEK